jgi:uncharacterized protein YndB with AHSA1/START domain
MGETYRGRIRIEAAPSRVFEFFTDASSLARWMGDSAVVDPRPGGEFTLHINGGPIAGRYVVVDPPSRVVITWGRSGDGDFPPGSSALSVNLIPDGTGTVVEIEHSGLPVAESRQHAVGWQHYLPRLAAAAAGFEPGPDPWARQLPPDAVPGSQCDVAVGPDART